MIQSTTWKYLYIYIMLGVLQSFEWNEELFFWQIQIMFYRSGNFCNALFDNILMNCKYKLSIHHSKDGKSIHLFVHYANSSRWTFFFHISGHNWKVLKRCFKLSNVRLSKGIHKTDFLLAIKVMFYSVWSPCFVKITFKCIILCSKII